MTTDPIAEMLEAAALRTADRLTDGIIRPLIGERDRARDIAVRLEQELARAELELADLRARLAGAE